MTPRILPVLCLLVLMLVACDSGSADLPTLVPTLAPATAVEESNPTNSDAQPVVEETPATATDAPPTETPFVRPTLPPTNTPTLTATASPTPTATIITATFFIPDMVIPPECENFAVDFANSALTFTLGEAPTVTWTAVPGATQYNVTLEDANQRIILDGIFVAETSYTFPADIFERGELYGWKVYPLDASIVQMCSHTGQELIPRVPVPGQ